MKFSRLWIWPVKSKTNIALGYVILEMTWDETLWLELCNASVTDYCVYFIYVQRMMWHVVHTIFSRSSWRLHMPTMYCAIQYVTTAVDVANGTRLPNVFCVQTAFCRVWYVCHISEIHWTGTENPVNKNQRPVNESCQTRKRRCLIKNINSELLGDLWYLIPLYVMLLVVSFMMCAEHLLKHSF